MSEVIENDVVEIDECDVLEVGIVESAIVEYKTFFVGLLDDAVRYDNGGFEKVKDLNDCYQLVKKPLTEIAKTIATFSKDFTGDVVEKREALGGTPEEKLAKDEANLVAMQERIAKQMEKMKAFFFFV